MNDIVGLMKDLENYLKSPEWFDLLYEEMGLDPLDTEQIRKAVNDGKQAD